MAGQHEPLRKGKPMTGAELDNALFELNLTQAELAELLCITPRAMRRYLAHPESATWARIPMPVAILIRLLVAKAVDYSTAYMAGDGRKA